MEKEVCQKLEGKRDPETSSEKNSFHFLFEQEHQH
jgi:hypothetical protein